MDETPKESNIVNAAETAKFIEQLDKMYREKPAGFFAYITTCQSAMKIANLEETDENLGGRK